MAKDEARYRQKWRGGFQQAGGLGRLGDDDDGVDDYADGVGDQDDGDDVESHQGSQGRGGPVLQGPEEEVPLLQGSMALDPVEDEIISILNLIFSLKVAANFLLKEVFKETRTKCSPPEVQRARIQPGFSESRRLNGRRVQTTNSIVGIGGNAELGRFADLQRSLPPPLDRDGWTGRSTRLQWSLPKLQRAAAFTKEDISLKTLGCDCLKNPGRSLFFRSPRSWLCVSWSWH